MNKPLQDIEKTLTDLHIIIKQQNNMRDNLPPFRHGPNRKSCHIKSTLNIKADFYKLLVFLDGVKPDIRFEVRRSAPQT